MFDALAHCGLDLIALWDDFLVVEVVVVTVVIVFPPTVLVTVDVFLLVAALPGIV